MIVPDLNLLIYAYNEDAPFHEEAKKWWESLLNTEELVGLSWLVTVGFIRLMTHRSVLKVPMALTDCCDIIEDWLNVPIVQPLEPGPRHFSIFRKMLSDAGCGGNLTTDAHLAALAIEHSCTLHSNDADFGRFTGLRWINPLRG